MTIRETWDLLDEPAPAEYQSLLALATRYCREFSLVVQASPPLGVSGRAVLDRLRPFLVAERSASEWPGTQLLDGVATVYRFRLTLESAELLGRCSPGLFSWIQPDLPEDLCLFRSDSTPWLVTIGHERDAYFVISPDEREILVQEIPGLLLARHSRIAKAD